MEETERFETFSYARVVKRIVIAALLSKALQEKGREFTTKDSGVEFVPPEISEILMKQAALEIDMLNRMME